MAFDYANPSMDTEGDALRKQKWLEILQGLGARAGGALEALSGLPGPIPGDTSGASLPSIPPIRPEAVDWWNNRVMGGSAQPGAPWEAVKGVFEGDYANLYQMAGQSGDPTAPGREPVPYIGGVQSGSSMAQLPADSSSMPGAMMDPSMVPAPQWPPASMGPDGGGIPGLGAPGVPTGTGIDARPPKMQVPQREEIPQMDYSAVYNLLDQAAPQSPEEMSKLETFVSMLGGLAAGAAQGYAYGGDVSSVTIGAMSGGAQRGEQLRADARTKQEQYEERLSNHALKVAEVRANEILTRHGIDVKNIEIANQQKAEQAMADYNYAKDLMPKVETGPYGTQWSWADPVTGELMTNWSPGPVFAANALEAAARERQILLKSLGGSGAKVDQKVSFLNLGELDLSTMGIDAPFMLSAYGWAENSPVAAQQVQYFRQDMMANPDTYGIDRFNAKPQDYDRAAYKRVAMDRYTAIANAYNLGDQKTLSDLMDEGSRYIGDMNHILQRRQMSSGALGGLVEDQGAIGNPLDAFMGGLK